MMTHEGVWPVWPDDYARSVGQWHKGLQAIAAEMSDFSIRRFDDGMVTMEQLTSARSFDQAYSIQASFAKRSYDEYVHQVTKIGGMYSGLAKDACRPLESAFSRAGGTRGFF